MPRVLRADAQLPWADWPPRQEAPGLCRGEEEGGGRPQEPRPRRRRRPWQESEKGVFF